MSQQDVKAVEELRKNKIIEDNFDFYRTIGKPYSPFLHRNIFKYSYLH